MYLAQTYAVPREYRQGIHSCQAHHVIWTPQGMKGMRSRHETVVRRAFQIKRRGPISVQVGPEAACNLSSRPPVYSYCNPIGAAVSFVWDSHMTQFEKN